MIKKIIFSLLFLIVSINLVHASTTPMAKIGNEYFDTLEEAIKSANSDDIITLVSNVSLDETLLIDKVVNLNLNGNNITAPNKVFMVKGGTLNVSGKGTIKEENPNYGAIYVVGSNTKTGDKYSVVNIEKDVTLEGWSGVFITHENYKSYGVSVNVDGKINALDDVNGDTGVGIYVNGNIKEKTESPVINITDNAIINSTGPGLYIAGYSTFNIGDAKITGVESGIAIKSGILNIDGASITCTGVDKTPTTGFNNGVKPSGATIQIESNSGYAGGIELNISNGNFVSKNSNVVYEYIGKGNSSLIYSMSFSNGTFVSQAGKNVFSFSDSFKDIHSGFISGGKYSSDPSEYLKSGYSVSKQDNLYTVIKSSMKIVNSNNFSENNSNSVLKTIIIFVSIILIGIVAYLKKDKLYNLIKR